MLWIATVPTVYFAGIIYGREFDILNVSLGKMKSAHTAVIVALTFIVVTVATLLSIAHSIFLA